MDGCLRLEVRDLAACCLFFAFGLALRRSGQVQQMFCVILLTPPRKCNSPLTCSALSSEGGQTLWYGGGQTHETMFQDRAGIHGRGLARSRCSVGCMARCPGQRVARPPPARVVRDAFRTRTSP